MQQIIFKAQNQGESEYFWTCLPVTFCLRKALGVKIAIPYSVILDIDRSTAMDFSETIEVKVVDRDHFTMDSYFFAYFQSLPAALEQIRSVVKAYKQAESNRSSRLTQSSLLSTPVSATSIAVTDTTLQRSPSTASNLGGTRSHRNSVSMPMEAQSSSGSQSGGFSFTSLLRPFSDGVSLRRTTSPDPLTHADPAHDYTHVLPAPDASSSESHALNRAPSILSTTDSTVSGHSAVTARPKSSDAVQHHIRQHGLTYPPSTPPLPPTIETTPSDLHHASTAPPAIAVSTSPKAVRDSHRSSWTGWLKAPSRRLFSAGGASTATDGESPAADIPAVVEHSTRPEGAAEEEREQSMDSTGGPGTNNMAFSMLEMPEGTSEHGLGQAQAQAQAQQDAIVAEKFRQQFALDEKEKLVGCELDTTDVNQT